MSHEATINWDDGHIRFWPEARLDDEEYKATREAGLNWSRGEQCFKGPWSPWKEKFLADQFGIEGLADDETDLMERAESRAEYYQGWSDNAAKRSDQAHDVAHEISSNIPFGQPILIGHHSEKRHRRDIERIDTNMRKAFQEKKRSDYWKGRAERAVAATERRYRPDVIYRRIQKLEAQLRKQQDNANRELWEAGNGMAWAIHEGKDPEKVWENRYAYAQRWIEFLEQHIAYQRALYEASGGIPAEEIKFEVGGAASSWAGLCEILRVNKKSVSVKRHIRDDIYWRETIPYDKIKKAYSKAEWERMKAGNPELK